MAIPAWPTGSVPASMLLDDFQVQQSHQPPLKTDLQSGGVRMRPQFTVRLTTIRASIYMTDAQLEAFKTFLFVTLAQGSSKFTMPLRINGADVTKTCLLADGTASWARMGTGWKVSLGLLVENY